MNSLRATLLLTLAACSVSVFAQQSKTLLPELTRTIPAPYLEELESLHPDIPAEEQQSTLKKIPAQPEAGFILALKYIGQQPQAFDFLTTQLAKDEDAQHRLLILTQSLRGQVRSLQASNRPLHSPSAVHAEIAEQPAKRHQLQAILEHLVATDTNADVALEAARDLRKLNWGVNGQLLLEAAENAHQRKDSAGEAVLRKEAYDWLTYDEQVNLPTFLRTPPPVFAVAPEGKSIRVLAFGDFGNGSPAQKQLAATMITYSQQHPFDFGITVGDNFYPRGVSSPNDPHWENDWEKVYGPLGISFYPTLGNHDYLQADGPAAEVIYTHKSKTWHMPATFYTYTAGPVQFFAIDTMEMSDTALYQQQLAWLDAEIAKSKARWKIVYGHYQVYSASRGDEQNLIDRLMPVLRNRVNLFLCGHDHNLQELQSDGGVNFFVSGAAGASLYDFTQKNYTRSTFQAKQNGFNVIEADQKSLKLSIVGLDGSILKSVDIH
ncbi:metallophosphoesterase [Terriglobus sp. RCC_193]|uniref:metallophosphoesterase n=1 Tax=Terriglobus sp. RCC_193 TaxID=3239218 RepID=UPI003523CE61